MQDLSLTKTRAPYVQDMDRPNIGLLRRLCLNLLKRETSKQSIAMKRFSAALDNDYALKILVGHDVA